jgi:hypothetical protein
MNATGSKTPSMPVVQETPPAVPAGPVAEQVKKEKKTNPWNEHVKKFRVAHPDVSFKECLQRAKLTYKKKDMSEKVQV